MTLLLNRLQNGMIVASCGLAVLLTLISLPGNAAEPVLEIHIGQQVKQLSSAELLKSPDVRTIEIADDVSYKRKTQYRAVPFTALISAKQLAQAETVQFTALDGFVANIPGTLLNSAAQPWLAIEPADKPWSPLKPGKPSAGPFYLVWRAPGKAAVSAEQWPYQIATITETIALEKRFPQIVPKASASDLSSKAALRGMQVYIANCSVCHKINNAGDATIGPDLNRPFSPTEYFQDAFLRKLIRDPTSVRNWPQKSMPGFTATNLSDAQLNDLLVYLQQMAKQR
ncbi:c-type cytochrome [Glaciimonas soli]|nr:c-type cytochrome [Glaciimonas soli]